MHDDDRPVGRTPEPARAGRAVWRVVGGRGGHVARAAAGGASARGRGCPPRRVARGAGLHRAAAADRRAVLRRRAPEARPTSASIRPPAQASAGMPLDLRLVVSTRHRRRGVPAAGRRAGGHLALRRRRRLLRRPRSQLRHDRPEVPARLPDDGRQPGTRASRRSIPAGTAGAPCTSTSRSARRATAAAPTSSRRSSTSTTR